MWSLHKYVLFVFKICIVFYVTHILRYILQFMDENVTYCTDIDTKYPLGFIYSDME